MTAPFQMRSSMLPTILVGFCLVFALHYHPFQPASSTRMTSASDEANTKQPTASLTNEELLEKTREVASTLEMLKEWTGHVMDYVSNQATFHEDVVAQEIAVKKKVEQLNTQDDGKKLDADGCYHVFIDVGAHMGVHGRFLLEPLKYPNATNAHYFFDRWFGSRTTRDNRDFCIFAIEANPKHRQVLEAKANAYKKMGWRYEVINRAASDHEGTLELHHDVNDEVYDHGFSVKVSEKGAVDIPTLRLASWVKEHVGPRKLPSEVYGDYSTVRERGVHGYVNGGPKVVMKMDIEGSEYVVLPDMLTTGAICHIDFAFAEFHPQHAPFAFPESKGKSEFILTDFDRAKKYAKSIGKVINEARNCKARFKAIDESPHTSDEVPLPTPNSKGRKK
eukprot:CAMPEP_0172452718 /NCGR_PEP_ID=MMETSP1065-20121228/10297_1 /TAXON_ID=265537 /ORGANISM="Amphiprora paludosa, Strain CCMP125" /LENGTH=390 /DNA_ID=CAMNT_0013204823 /DNA_START=48 /DNA_END=1220 /DNA_ORIENTATION=-